MKLRNTKTREIAEIILNLNESLSDAIRRTIEEAGWEDVEYPLIKDPNIRKAVRAWAEANGTSRLTYDGFYILTDEEVNDIEFGKATPFERLEKGKEYTIEELCGEEKSLAELNEEWEDYKPKEPLIKDEKIRKAVRVWAEANGIKEVAVMCHLVWGENMTEMAKMTMPSLRIVFPGDLGIKMGSYTITELCGEEEE